MNKQDFIAELNDHISRRYVTRMDASKAWNISYAFLCAVVAGRKQVPAWMAKELGCKPVKRITYTFEEIKE